MTTYNVYQQLADATYTPGKTGVEINELTWNLLDHYNNIATGYYGALYAEVDSLTGEKTGNYILANQGTNPPPSGLASFDMLADMLGSDLSMATGGVPGQFADASKFMEKVQAYIGQNGGGSLSVTGHSLGGSISQLLAVAYGYEAVTFNAYNTREILNDLEPISQTQQTVWQEEIQTIHEQINADPNSANSGLLQLKISELESKLSSAQAIDKLYSGWQQNINPDNIINYVINGDPISSHVGLPNVGEVITIKYESKGESSWIGGDIAKYHSLTNFALDKLQNETKDVYISSSNGKSEALFALINETNFDKNKFEIDNTVGDVIRISSETELYFVAPNLAKRTDSTELIGELHEGDYVQSSFIKAGSKAEINEFVSDLLNDSTNKDYTVSIKNEGNKVYLEYSRKETLNYVDSSNLALGGKSGSELVTGSNGNWLKVTELTANSAGYHGTVYTDAKGTYVIVSTDETATIDNYHAASELVEKTHQYIAENGGGGIEFVGYAGGGAISQLLAQEYGGGSYNFNPQSSQSLTNGLTMISDETIESYRSSQQNILNQLTDSSNSSANKAALQQQLDQLQQQIDQAKANNHLVESVSSGKTDNIINYMINGDSSLNQSQPGKSIVINYESASNSIPGEYHSIDNFSLTKLKAAEELSINSSAGIEDKQFLELANQFKDKTKFEVDDMGNNVVRINQEHEFYFGVVSQFSDWQTTGDDRSQLITKPYDQIYDKVSLATVGTAGEVMAARQSTIDFMLSQKYEDGSPMYAVKHDVVNPDKQTYLLFTSLPQNKKPTQYDPLALDLDGSGKVETVGLSAGVVFDHDADGIKTGTGWVAPGDGLVVRDINYDGQITSGQELFGDNTILSNGQKAKNAFEAIADLDSNQDGRVDANDWAFGELKIWQDANLDGISQANELKSLTEVGVSSISTHASITGVQNEANGNVEIGYSSFERADGTKGSSGAFNFVGDPINSQFTDMIDTSQVMDIPNINGSGRVRDLREAAALSPELATAVRDYMKIDYPKGTDLDNIVKLWAETGEMDTLASTLKTGAHPNGARGTNLIPAEIDKLNILEKFTGLYAATSNFIDPMDSMDGRIDGRYTDQYYGINLDTQSINHTYASMLADIEHGLFSAIGKTSVYDLVDYKYANGKISIDFDRVLEWSKNTDNQEYATAQIANMLNNVANNQSVLISNSDVSEISNYLYENIRLYPDFTQYFSSVVINTGNAQFGSLIFGNSEDNTLVSYDESNSFLAGKGNDTLIAVSGNHQYIFNKGDGQDIINDWNGIDTIIFGKDIIKEDLRFITVGDGLFIQIGNNGDGVLIQANSYTDHQIEYFSFMDGSKFTYSELVIPMLATDAADTIFGSSSAETIHGKGGNDQIFGNGGNDIFVGGMGNDSIIAGIGDSNTYVFNLGDGQDIFNDWKGIDTIVFGGDIVKEDLKFTNIDDNLLIEIGNSGDNILIQANSYTDHQIEYFSFMDGSKFTYSELVIPMLATDAADTIFGSSLAETIHGKGENDQIFGNGGNDTFIGGVGNDSIVTESGENKYLFNKGDGSDTINDKSGVDSIMFGDGIAREDIKFIMLGNDLEIKIGNDGDSILIRDNIWNRQQIENFTFADGSSLTYSELVLPMLATDSNDVIVGSTASEIINGKDGADSIYGNGGNDVIKGGLGNDNIIAFELASNEKYIFNKGDGQDVITDRGGIDVIEFGEGIIANDLKFSQVNYSDLLITIGDGQDSITVKWAFSDTGTEDNFAIEEVKFSDGEVLSLSKLYGQQVGSNMDDTIYGLANDDVLHGYGGNDQLRGLSGNDVLMGDDGDDSIDGYSGNDVLDGGNGNDYLNDVFGNNTFIGGAGNDYIYSDDYGVGVTSLLGASNIIIGGLGNDYISSFSYKNNDTIIFNLGDGQDIVYDGGGTDTIKFGEGIIVNDISTKDEYGNLVINVGTGGDSITVQYASRDANRQIESFQFSDGNILSYSNLLLLRLSTSGNDTLNGGNGDDYIDGGSGEDIIAGDKGNDRLTGGLGNDTLSGGDGNDSYIYTIGDGKDTISDSSGNDRIILNQINSIDQVLTTRSLTDNGSEGDDLILGFVAEDGSINDKDQITLKNWFNNPNNQIESLMVAGTNFALATVVEERMTKLKGSDGDDNLVLSGKKNEVTAGKGNDTTTDTTLNNTTYLFNPGDGKDTILDANSIADKISFGNGINQSNLKFSQAGSDLLISLTNPATPEAVDQITIKDFANQNNRIENLTFSDGSNLNLADKLKQLNLLTDSTNLSKLKTSNGDDLVWLDNSATVNLREGNNTVLINSLGGLSTITAGAGNDRVELFDNGNSKLSLGNGNNSVKLNNGDNTITTGTGDDLINAKDGNNTIRAGDGQNQISLGRGTNSITTGTGNDQITLNGGNATISSGAGDDTIIIQNLQVNETATINSGAGNDHISINGTGGLSKLTTGTENDEVTINGTNSQISDSGGDNKITINNLNLGINATNTITLNKGNDTVLLNSDGTSIIKASDGENQIIITGNLGTNTVTSGSGADILAVSGQQNTISAGNGANQITAAGISNKITTGIDNDEITISSGNSTISSGAGDDTIIIQNLQANETTTINSGAGNDQITISGQGGIASITGGTGDDKIKLTNIVTTIKDSGGNNQISIDNSLLSNEINSITLGSGQDSLQMISNGTTTIKTSTGDKEINLAGTGTYSVTTSSGNDLISGGSANDIINAGDGNDTLSGKQGNDILNGGKGNDTYLFAKGDGQDIIQDNQGNDKIIFGEGITKENLWFKKQEKDLNITNTTTQDQLTVKNWYAGTTNQIESIELATGESIGNQSINLLVQAMATFDPQPMVDSGTSQPLPQAVQTAIGNTWVDPTA